MAQYALVFGPGGHDQPYPIVFAQPSQPADSAFQSDPAQESVEPKSSCLASGASAFKDQGCSKAVRIESPQLGSTKSVYETKWTIFTKWCHSNQVDFRAPPVKSIADILLKPVPGQEVAAKHR